MKKIRFSNYLCIFALSVLLLGMAGTAFAQGEKDPSVPIETLSFQGAEIRSVIRFLADYGHINVVVAPNVQGSVTINLHNVTWKQALSIIGQTYDLAVVFEDEGYVRVLPADKYREEQTNVEKHRMDQKSMVSLEVKIVRLKNTAAKEITESVRSLMSDRGKVEADERTNSLIIQEIPSNIDHLVEFIEELDKPARQIKISAQLLEIYSTDGLELGVDWDVTGSSEVGDPNNPRTITQTGTQTGDRVSDKFFSYSVNAMQHGWDVNAVISTIVSESKGKIIAHPEITTIENMEARIQMGSKVPVKQFDEAGNVVIKFEEVGTILRVTPHITADNQILMHLIPERSSLEPDANGIIIKTNNAETNVVVNNGQTAVIGGLTTQDEVEAEAGIPVLKDIPLLGMIFKYKQKQTEDRDLVIFVTPTIVEGDMASNTGP
jgi:type IV pilus secretin PilQ/predicted competence protein